MTDDQAYAILDELRGIREAMAQLNDRLEYFFGNKTVDDICNAVDDLRGTPDAQATLNDLYNVLTDIGLHPNG